MLMLARMVKMAATIVAGVIVVGIVLHVLGANPDNAVVGLVYDIDRPLVSPFKSLFDLEDAKAQIAVNWGIAAAVYALIGAVLASLLARAALLGGRRRGRAVA